MAGVQGWGSVPRRLVRRLYREVSTRLGRDPVAGFSISKRRDLRTLGSKGGQWTIPEAALNEASIVYCVGCGENISFDLELIARFGCVVHAFDPTPRAVLHVERVAADNPKYRFQPIGLWNEEAELKFFAPKNPGHVSHSLLNLQKTSDGFLAKVRRLSSIMTELGHVRLDLLKLDIEGAEYEVLDSLLEDGLDVRVLCVEFDEYFQPLDASFRERIRAAIERLCAAGFVLIHTPGTANYTFERRLGGEQQGGKQELSPA